MTKYHQAGTISGVAAVYQRHDFLSERRQALDLWGGHIGKILNDVVRAHRSEQRVHVVAAVKSDVPPASILVRLVASHGCFGVPGNGDSEAGAQTDAGTANCP